MEEAERDRREDAELDTAFFRLADGNATNKDGLEQNGLFSSSCPSERLRELHHLHLDRTSPNGGTAAVQAQRTQQSAGESREQHTVASGTGPRDWSEKCRENALLAEMDGKGRGLATRHRHFLKL